MIKGGERMSYERVGGRGSTKGCGRGCVMRGYVMKG